MRKVLMSVLTGLFLLLFLQTTGAVTFKAYEIVLKTSEGDIFGVITLPDSVDSPPIVIIIAGGGSTDCDGNSLPRIQTNTYKQIAENLGKSGIASIRYDKRGVAKSSGVKASNHITFDDYLQDARAWVSYARVMDKFSKIFIIGHGEGSLIGMIIAEKAKLNGFISLEGAGKSEDQLLRDQLINAPDSLIIESNKILDSLAAGKTVTHVHSSLTGVFHPSIQSYLISKMKYDPAKELIKTKIPVLIVHGKNDLEVPSENAYLLAKSRPDAKLLVFEKMNYILKDVDDPSKNRSLYYSPNVSINQEMMKQIIGFINKPVEKIQ